MNTANHNDPDAFPTIEFHRRNPRKDEGDHPSSTQVMMGFRQMQFNDIVRRSAALKPISVTTPEKAEPAPKLPKKEKPRKILWHLWDFRQFRKIRFWKAHA